MDNAAGLRVTIWHPYVPSQPVSHHSAEHGPTYFAPKDLQQDVFSWQVRDDVWGGIAAEEIRRSLRDGFISAFDPYLPPGDRSVEKLTLFVQQLRKVVRSSASDWSVSGQEPDDDADSSPRLNALLAFERQLSWMEEVFRHLPGVSVTVR